MDQALYRKLSLPALILAALLAIFAIACGADDPADPEGTPAGEASPEASVMAEPTEVPPFPREVVDSGGETVLFESAAQRIISYSPGATEILYAVGAGAQVVGTDQFSDYPPEVLDLPKLDYSLPAPEPALALEPDLVIMAGNQEGQVELFRNAGMTVLFLREPENVEGVIEQVRLLGQLAGHAEEADALALGMEARLDSLMEKASAIAESPLVFIELTPDGFTAGPGSFLGSLLEIVNARNVAEAASGAFPQLSAEAIIAANPDVILLTDSGDFGGQSLATVQERPGWDTIAAVQNGRVYEVDGSVFSRPGPRIIEAMEALAVLLYPD